MSRVRVVGDEGGANRPERADSRCRHCQTIRLQNDKFCGGCGKSRIDVVSRQGIGRKDLLRFAGLLLVFAAFAIPLGLYLASLAGPDVFRLSPPLLVLLLVGVLALLLKGGSSVARFAARSAATMVAVGVLLTVVAGASIAAAFEPQVMTRFAQPVHQAVAPVTSGSAWQATTSTSVFGGNQGWAPLVVRPPQVPQLPPVLHTRQPLALYAIPTAQPSMFQPVALANQHGVLPLTNTQSSMWLRMPPEPIRIHTVVLLPNARPMPQNPLITHPSVLRAGCTSCWSQVQLNVNPEYAQKLAWEGAKVFALAFTIPRMAGLVSATDLFSLTEVVSDMNRAWHDQGLAAAIEVGRTAAKQWVTSKFAGLVLGSAAGRVYGEPGELTAGLGVHLAGLGTQQNASQPAWSWQVNRVSGGSSVDYGTTTQWISVSSDTYRGTFIQEGWVSNTITSVIESSRPPVTVPPTSFDTPSIPSIDSPTLNPPSIPRFEPPSIPSYNPPTFNPPSIPRYNPPNFTY